MLFLEKMLVKINQRKLRDQLLNIASAREGFNFIYKNNYWGNIESKSGNGSSLYNASKVLKHLPIIVKKFNIKTILDIPCGDFNWMKYFVEISTISYVGADIVKDLILENKLNYENSNISFKELDITCDSLPKADLMICRDLIFHFSYSDYIKLINNYIASEIPFLLTSTHKLPESYKNKDIKTGDFKLLNIYNHPYLFSKDPLCIFDEEEEDGVGRQMGLWTREQIMKSFSQYG